MYKKAKTMLRRELTYFKKIQDELRAKNPNGGYVVIKDNEVLGIWLNRTDALKVGIDKWGNVPFLVKDINDDINKAVNFSRNIKFTHAISNAPRN